ncbi:hypothetical protein ANCCEY_12968 [Ancylostoma ceylanicum]|uniref:Methyltransferase type 11 domain-containing protein n=1 Tax=Ancylostoma ceylanicum TaxID=53326 RepID=A0A0D6LJW6_9BILA|nr:hypothetical protein ANCCEY_12968 [Ancylostoma ceylanicum]
MGIDSTCHLIEGDCHNMPLEDSSKDAAYAIYSLKYFPQLDGVMKEVSRVLKQGGRFLVYDLMKTEKYDKNNEEHVEDTPLEEAYLGELCISRASTISIQTSGVGQEDARGKNHVDNQERDGNYLSYGSENENKVLR